MLVSWNLEGVNDTKQFEKEIIMKKEAQAGTRESTHGPDQINGKFFEGAFLLIKS